TGKVKPAAAEKPEEEPEGPLVQRKHQGDSAESPDAQVDVSQIKPLPTAHGRVKFPPPPEGEGDEEELAQAMAAKNSKMSTPKNVSVAADGQGELTVDPSSLGSYHVQISLSPYFRRAIVDNVYGFGSDVRLEDEIEAAGGGTGRYYIRWALIDLLDMEH